MDRILLIRYGEIGLKGQNRTFFEDALLRNIERVLQNVTSSKESIRVRKSQGRLFVTGVTLNNERDLIRAISKVPGVVGVSPAVSVENDIDLIIHAAVCLMQEAVDGTVEMKNAVPVRADVNPTMPTFRVSTKRPNKNFPMTSPDVNQKIGNAILQNMPKLSVDLHNPDIVLHIEIRDKRTYLYAYEAKGPGGLPIGVSGKGTVLLSGGIDSPVSAYMAMKRGVDICALHFWSYPITGERSKEKVVDICKVLTQFDPDLRLYIAPFTEIQTNIIKDCPETYRITIMRRMMMRVATSFCKQTGSQAIFTGESLGQVASQTLESLTVIEEAAGFPILRPLICFDKTEIVSKSREIGTYDISCQPYDDCCSVFVPKHPVTRPTVKEAVAAERKLNIDELVNRCVLEIQEVSVL